MADFETTVNVSPGTDPATARNFAVQQLLKNASARGLSLDRGTVKMKTGQAPRTYVWTAMARDGDERMICVCRKCGSWYDMDMHEALYCHDGDQDWAIVTGAAPGFPPDEYVYYAPDFKEEM